MNPVPNKHYRHRNNPLEKVFHDTFIDQFDSYDHIDLERICLPIDNRGNPLDTLSDRERQIMINTIQWLGSPVGQSFLRDCGLEFVQKEYFHCQSDIEGYKPCLSQCKHCNDYYKTLNSKQWTQE